MSAARTVYGLTLAAAAAVGVVTGLRAADGLRTFLDRLAEIGDYPIERTDCPCWTCNPELQGRRMFLCNECGNKRCPKATDHRNACTGSNEPDQAGSRYARGGGLQSGLTLAFNAAPEPVQIHTLPEQYQPGATVEWFDTGCAVPRPGQGRCSLCLQQMPFDVMGWRHDGQGWICPRHE